MNRTINRLWPVLVVSLHAAGVGAVTATTHSPDSRVIYGTESERMLVLGCVTRDVRYNYGRMRGIAEYVLDQFDPQQISGVEVVTVRDSAAMQSLLRSGRVDWVSATPFDAVSLVDKANGEILLAKEQRGKAWYKSVFFARKDSGIDSINDLVGKTIAFERPSSTSAYLVPAAVMRAAGLKLVPLDSVREAPPADAVGYVFSGDESNSSLWVHKKIVAAGAFSDADWHLEWNLPEKIRPDMQIFHRSRPIPRGMEIVRRDLPEALKSSLRAALMAAPANPAAGLALRDYYATTGFYEVDDDVRSALDYIRDGARLVDADESIEAP